MGLAVRATSSKEAAQKFQELLALDYSVDFVESDSTYGDEDPNQYALAEIPEPCLSEVLKITGT